MSDEAQNLIEALIGAAMEPDASPEDTDENVHYQRVALREYIERIEHERDEARGTIKQLSESAVLMFQEAECRFEEHREKNKRLERENEEVRRWLRIRTDSKNAAEDKVAGLEARTVELEAENARLQAIVDEQAEDEGLWFVAETAPEAYLQQELRRLHAAIDAARKP